MRAVLRGDLGGGRVQRGRVRGIGSRWRGGRGGDEAVDGCAGSVGWCRSPAGRALPSGSSTWTWRSTATAISGSVNPARIRAPWARRSAPPDTPRGEHARAGRLLMSAEQRAEVVQPPGGGVDPDPAGSFLRRYPLVGGHAELDPDALGRRSHRSAFSVRSARFAVRSRISRRQNSNSSAAITGISPNASGAAGRLGACVQLKKLLAATRPHTASRGARPGSARAAPAHQQHRADSCRAIEREEQQVGPGPRRAMFERAKPTRPCAEMPAAVDANPAEQRVLGRGRYCLPCTRVLARHASAS